MSRLEDLCRPFLKLVCSRCDYARAGADVDPESLKRAARAELEAMRQRCEGDPVLRREFERVEKPLVFFADYCIKSGDTALARGWTDLGRDYSELSGDEKFYDMLSATMDDPEASERLRLFYLMLGLGFDGVHAGDPEFVRRRMKLCATRFTLPEDTGAWRRADVATSYPHGARRSRLLAGCFLAAVVFAAIAFGFNYHRFCCETHDYREALGAASSLAETPSGLIEHVVDASGKEAR